MTAKEAARKVYAAIEDKKGADITVLDIASVTPIADYFIIASGENRNQVQAIADNVTEMLGKEGKEYMAIEGYQTANWILLDYGDIVVHIFNKEDRRFYDLERIWRDGKFVTVEDLM
ncbi:MAG: ribosome silencing factor [Lachnospiraceae bacterium]